MGYILPVERYQYADYQSRGYNHKRADIRTNPTFRVVLEKHHQEVVSEYNRLDPSSYKMVNKEPQFDRDVERAYAEVTGKGKNVSLTV